MSTSDPLPAPPPARISSSTTRTDTDDGRMSVSVTTTKPGHHTTEFYLAVAAMLLSALYATGVLAPSDAGPVAKAVAVAAFMLTSAGYSVSRGLAKS